MEEYIKKVCSTCKNNDCHITRFKDKGITYIKCTNYKKDEDKIKGYKRPLERTAKISKLVMPKLISDWSRL